MCGESGVGWGGGETGHWKRTLLASCGAWTCKRPTGEGEGGGVFIWKEAAEAAPESRGCPRRPKWRASVQSTVGGHAVHSEQKSHNSPWPTDFLKRGICLDRDFHCEKGQGGLLYKGCVSQRLQNGLHSFSLTILSLPPPVWCDFVLRITYLLPTLEPECLGQLRKKKRKSQHIHYDLRSVLFFFWLLLLFIFLVNDFQKEVFLITPNTVGSDCFM